VDREFGTGALKVTPGHDLNDYELGKKHNLAVINVLNRDATMNAAAGKYVFCYTIVLPSFLVCDDICLSLDLLVHACIL
jgi:hypothetical protein